MKKKFGLFALVLAVLLCGSLFLLAACDETEEDPADTPATISVTVNGTAQTSGGTYDATVGTAYTFAATASNGNAVTISYVFGDAAAEELNGTSFTPETAGSYTFTFTAEGATSFTLTLVATEAEVPPATQYTVTYRLGEHAATDAQAPTEQTVAENTQVTLPAAVEAAEGYTFGGWNDGTTTYEAGAEYTVTGNVTMTAVWNVVHTHTYTWEVTTYPVESDGAATGTCSGCAEGTEGHTKTVTLPKVIGVDETGSNLIVGAVPDSGAQVGKYYVTVTNPTCTVDGSMAFFYVYDEKTVISFTYTVEGTALGHAYVVEYDSATMTSAGWTATATCDRSGCGATYEFTNVPAVDSEDTDNWSETSKIDYEGQMPTCTTDGKTALAYKNAAPDGGVLIVKNVPIPALGHAYEISYEAGTVKASCPKCESVCSATVTISGGEDATGNTVLAAEDFAFNAETQQFTVTLPENGYTYDGHTFSGWLVGGETYTEGQTVTVAADGSLEIVAQWTAVNVPQISLDVKVDGQYPIETTDGGNTTACVGTNIHYAASVSEGQVTVSYTLKDGEAQSLSAEGDFTFAEAGTYVFTITAPGADDYTFTVNVKEHEWGAWGVTSAPSDSEEGEISRTCSVTNHTFSLSVPILTDANVTDSNEEGKYTVETNAATCTESGSATYIYNIPSEYGGSTYSVATVTLPQSEHSYGAATVDEATGNIIQTCANCPATQTLATLTGLSVGWAEGKQGWYTVGGTINASDFDVTYTYEGDVAAYEDIIKAAITNDITNTDKTATTGIKTVTFTLGGQSASIDVMVYAADETNGAKVLQNKMGTAVSALGTAYDVAAIPDAVTNGFAVSFWKTGDADSDWSTIVISGKGADGANGFDITLPNLDPYDYGGDWTVNAFPVAEDFRNGGTYDDFILGPAFITVSVNADGSVAYYLNGVLKIMYQSTKTVGSGGKTVGEFVSILLNDVQSYGFALGSAVAGTGVVGDDLFVTNALTDAQAAAMFKAYQMPQMDTDALMSGIEKEVFASSYAASVYKAEAISGVAESGLSISFNLIGVNHGTNPVATNWDDIILGTGVELDVCLGVLDAWGNTSASMAGDFNCYNPSYGDALYFRPNTRTVSGFVTVTLTTEGSVVIYHNGDQQIEYTSGDAVGTHTVATMVNAIFTEIAANSFDVCEGVDASELLLTAALDETQAKQLYENWQGLHA